MRRTLRMFAVAGPLFGTGMAAVIPPLAPAVNSDFTHFESGHVHPVAMTPDGTRLLVVNTPDARLSVFDITGPAPVRVAEIPVGLEPVSVAVRGNGEAWVVNHLSDDVSIVDLATMHTRATLRVGDEPSDIVFAGPGDAAFVSVSQEDAVKVYDPNDLEAPPTVIPIPGRAPRSLARNGGGDRVLVDVFNSSAAATALSAAEAGDSLPPLDPPLSPSLPPAPRTGLVLKRDQGHWTDASGHLWDSKIPYEVPLVEIVTLDAAARTVLATRGEIASIVMGLAVHPASGATAVSGTYAALEIQLEPNIRGRMTRQRAAIFTADSPAALIELNPHVDYSVTPGPPSDADSALGIPTGVGWSADGGRVYVTSLATDKLGVIDPSSGSVVARVPVVAGPTGVFADPARPRLYVVGRFRNQLQTLSSSDFSSLGVASVGFDPTPDAIVNGRRFFYGGFTSGHGDQSCASCHVFGDVDHFAWNLGDPQGAMSPVPSGMIDPLLLPSHPVKGPMMTQSLRGLAGTGRLHWRADRADLNAFNPAFVGLMGRSSALPDSEMKALSDFVLPLVYPPNPHQFLDRSMPDAPPGVASARRGETFFKTSPTFTRPPFQGLRCVNCHALPLGTNGQIVDGGAILGPQDMKIPHLRNLYTKTGFEDSAGVVNKRGFGFTHDGSLDNLFRFLKSPIFDFGSRESVADAARRDVERYLLAFDTGMAPAVGAQVTFDGSNNADAGLIARLDTLIGEANRGSCELIAKGRIATTPRGWKYQGAGSWVADLAAEASRSTADLLALASSGRELTVTGVPVGSGQRMGLDRDRDGFRDGDELLAGTDPGDPQSNPTTGVVVEATARDGLQRLWPSPSGAGTHIDYGLARGGPVHLAIFDIAGRRVRGLVDGVAMPAGVHTATWDGRDAAGRPTKAGVYFVRLRAAGRVWTSTVTRLE